MDEPRAVRRAAFQALYQLDACDGNDMDMVDASLETCEGLTTAGRAKAKTLAHAAWLDRRQADAAMLEFAPTWPANRQAAVDRAILRLAYHEIVTARVAPAIAINEAVELAKQFSADKSPGFVNALLDRIAQRFAGQVQTAAQDGADTL